MATRNIVPRADGEGQLGTAVKEWGKVVTKEYAGDGIGSEAEHESPEGVEKLARLDRIYASPALMYASMPDHYERSRPWKVKDRTANRNTICSPDYLTVNINNSGYVLTSAVELDINLAANWDDSDVTDWTDAANRAG